MGKNALVERVSDLLGNYARTEANERYLYSNFNAHLERNLLFVLDEVVWGGNKKTEGVLKDVITGRYRSIERKGMEAYTVKNLSRVFMLSNSDWAVPMSADERRFTVFEVGSKRKQDAQYFAKMRKILDDGGNEQLMDFLANVDISGYDFSTNLATPAALKKVSDDSSALSARSLTGAPSTPLPL